MFRRFNKNTCWSLIFIAMGAGIIFSFFFPSWFLAILGGAMLFFIGVLLLLC
jgi:hypothetical protein